MKKETINKITWITIFAIAMGFLETAVVVYLRKIYYPDGFTFPLAPIDYDIGLTEILREAATMIMLVGIGIFAGRTKTEKFGFFIYTFAIWDIFYYVFLKLLLDWPESFLTFDILFLIPVTWVGPIICPIINALSMILLALFITFFTDKNKKTHIDIREWLLLIGGSIVIIFSYIKDYTDYLSKRYNFSEIFDFLKWDELANYGSEYIPLHFDWWTFAIGQIILLSAIVIFCFRNKNPKNRNLTFKNICLLF